ncbi:MAG: DUF1232 domain-containing protein [Parcubacteria group bacterium]|jgi:uncharacterized membrane protein YkvA (DUF1232 family)
MKSIIVGIIGVLAFLYLINPTAGLFEILPDNIPLIGNVDEVTATTLLLSSLAYFGIDLGHLFKRNVTKVNEIKEAEYEEK